VEAAQEVVGMETQPRTVEEAQRLIGEHKSFVENVFAEHALVELEKDSEHITRMLANCDTTGRNRWVSTELVSLPKCCEWCAFSHWCSLFTMFWSSSIKGIFKSPGMDFRVNKLYHD